MLRSLVLLVALWWILTGGDPASWVFGGPFIAAALLARQRLHPPAPSKISAGGALRFLAGFFGQSFVSGVDVVRRAFHPRLPLAPGLVEHVLRLRSPSERILAAGTVSLLPGTLSVNLEGHNLQVHVLDLGAPVVRGLQDVETRVAGLHASPAPFAVSGVPHEPE